MNIYHSSATDSPVRLVHRFSLFPMVIVGIVSSSADPNSRQPSIPSAAAGVQYIDLPCAMVVLDGPLGAVETATSNDWHIGSLSMHVVSISVHSLACVWPTADKVSRSGEHKVVDG